MSKRKIDTCRYAISRYTNDVGTFAHCVQPIVEKGPSWLAKFCSWVEKTDCSICQAYRKEQK